VVHYPQAAIRQGGAAAALAAVGRLAVIGGAFSVRDAGARLPHGVEPRARHRREGGGRRCSGRGARAGARAGRRRAREKAHAGGTGTCIAAPHSSATFSMISTNAPASRLAQERLLLGNSSMCCTSRECKQTKMWRRNVTRRGCVLGMGMVVAAGPLIAELRLGAVKHRRGARAQGQHWCALTRLVLQVAVRYPAAHSH
jgi:hypothetical protein